MTRCENANHTWRHRDAACENVLMKCTLAPSAACARKANVACHCFNPHRLARSVAKPPVNVGLTVGEVLPWVKSVCPATYCPLLPQPLMSCMHAGLVECEAVGSIPGNTTRPQLHVYDRCIQRYR